MEGFNWGFFLASLVVLVVFSLLVVVKRQWSFAKECEEEMEKEKKKYKHIESLLSQYSSLEDVLEDIRLKINKLESMPVKKPWFPWLYKKFFQSDNKEMEKQFTVFFKRFDKYQR